MLPVGAPGRRLQGRQVDKHAGGVGGSWGTCKGEDDTCKATVVCMVVVVDLQALGLQGRGFAGCGRRSRVRPVFLPGRGGAGECDPVARRQDLAGPSGVAGRGGRSQRTQLQRPDMELRKVLLADQGP